MRHVANFMKLLDVLFSFVTAIKAVADSFIKQPLEYLIIVSH